MLLLNQYSEYASTPYWILVCKYTLLYIDLYYYATLTFLLYFLYFTAQYFGLPLLPPSKASGSDFKKGANMAIIGATAQTSDFFFKIGVGSNIWNNGPLDTQIQWFQNIASSVCGSSRVMKPFYFILLYMFCFILVVNKEAV